MHLPDRDHRFSPLLRDVPILDGDQPLQLDDRQRNRLGWHLELTGLRKQEASLIKWWPPPRGHQQTGNAGFWVPIDAEDPPEVKLPHPDDMTAEERHLMREWLAKYDPDTEREL
ncbi:DUF2744 domain-containing protein [Jatrophihabitans endophyticus]|uniref:phage gene 29 protein family protein n=1 Tax=Jatrophihabitans endophyticus TaxID=1206085 RepID=UPI001A0FD7F8|nr:DUF2744 domain-containing protein [Jatrophihabitans endophyticus]MBE7190477.1 DUF2744 domain-containing protein [Jatrophihabitans endophyticus]